MFGKIFFYTVLLCPLSLCSIELMKDYFDYNAEKPLPTVANDFVYGDGTTELTTQINEYDNLVAGKPIQGSIFVTHDSKNTVDVNSFRLGNKELKVNLVQNAPMSSTSSIEVSIYRFQLDGLPVGVHTLPPINVKVGGKEVQALPLIIEVPK